MTGKDRYAAGYRLLHPDPPARRGVPVIVAEMLLLREGDDRPAVVSRIEVERASYVNRLAWVARARYVGHPLLPDTFDGARQHADFAEAREFGHTFILEFAARWRARGIELIDFSGVEERL